MRKRKWLRRLGYFVAFLVILYFAFWAALFNPLEGGVDRLEDLVPKSVSFAIHSPWGALRASELFDRHVLKSPVVEDIEAAADLETRLYEPLREIEDQINASVPGFLGKFSVLDDVAGKEFLLAGNLNGPGDTLSEKLLNSPFVALTRISYKCRFMDVLKYGFVREKVPNLNAYGDIYEYELDEAYLAKGAPESAKYRYFRRIKDVLVVSNSRELIEAAVRFGLAGSAAGSTDENLPRHYYYYYDLNHMPQEPGITVWVQLAEANRELGHELEGYGPSARGNLGSYLRAFVPVGLVRTLTLRLGVEGGDVIPLRGTIRMFQRDDFPDHLYELHHGGGRKVGKLPEEIQPWVGMVPRDRTYVFTWMTMSPRDFLLTIFSALDETTWKLLFEQGENGESWDEQRLASQLGDWFEPGIALTQARLPEADSINLDSFDGGVPEPLPATTFFARLKPQLQPDSLVEFFKRHHEQFGLKAPEEMESATGRLFRLPFTRDKSLELIDPGFALVRRKFVFSSNVGELQRMLEVEAGQAEALTEDEEFQAAVASCHGKANVFLFVKGERLRPFLADQRYEYALNASEYNRVEYRKNLVLELNREHRDWKTNQLNQEADRRMEERERRRQEVDFPEAIQEYRNLLYRFEPFDWLGLSLSLAADTASNKLDLKGELVLQQVGGE